MEQNLDESLNPSREKITTRAVGIRYGLILAVVGILYFLIIDLSGLDMTQSPWKWISYVYLAVGLFLAHKYFKDKGNGYMSFGEGVGIGFWAGLISSVITSIFTFIYVQFIDNSFIQKILDNTRKGMEEGGKMSEEQIETAMGWTEKFTTPTMMLIFGVIFGIIGFVIISLVLAIFTQKRNPVPEYN